MVEIRVAVTDTVGVHGLLRRLAALFDRSALSFDSARKEVRIESEWESRSVVQVIDVVQSWLVSYGADSVELFFGDRSYTIVGPGAAA